MDYQSTATFEETKAYFRNLWRSMASECVLKNLQRILNFIQSPAEEVCFVNMQEKYLPFYFMIVLDEEFLQTTILTDECKVATHAILKILEANRNYFFWKVSFSRQIAGISVVFKKVFTQPCKLYPSEPNEIRSAFKETWIKTTLKFIKSSKLILKYPEMPRREAMYIYKGILKLNDEELGLNSLWLPVWEALNILKLRYEYIVSIHPTSFDYLKFVHFEKVTLIRESCAIMDENPISKCNMNDLELLIAGDPNDIKNNVTSNYRTANDLQLPVVNNKELINTLLEENVTKSDGYNTVTKPSNEKVEDILPILENEAVELVPTKPSDEIVDITLSTAVQDEGDMKNIQQINLNANDAGFSQQVVTVLNDNPSKYQDKTIFSKSDIISDHKSNENEDKDTIASENIAEEAMKLLGNRVDENAIKDVNANDAAVVILSAVNEIISSNKESQLIEPNTVIEEIGISDMTDSLNENPFFRQISKPQRQNQPLYLKEVEFGIIGDENDSDYTATDVILINKMQMINFNNDYLQQLGNIKNKIKHPLSEKAQTKREAKLKRRIGHKISRKRRLINTVPIKFLFMSLKTILNFIKDDSRTSLEMVSLNIHEFNVLSQLYSFSPEVVPTEKVFHKICWALAKDLFNCLMEKKITLHIRSIIPTAGETNTSVDPTRRRSVTYIKTSPKKSSKIPVSILEKMCLKPVPERTELSPGSRRESPGHRGSQSQSVSPPRNKLIPMGQRPAAVNPTGNLEMTMKTNILEKLAVPLESDKASRMMRLMGWKGGALGVREGGLIEPIQPQFNVTKGVGFGYETVNSTNVCTDKLQTKGCDKKYVSEQKAQNNTMDKNIVGNISENHESEISLHNKDNIGDTKKSLINVNNVVDTQNNSNELVAKSREDADAWTMKSSIDKNTRINTRDDRIGKSNLETDSTAKMEANSRFTLQMKHNLILSANSKDNVQGQSLELKNMQTVKPIAREVSGKFQMKNNNKKYEAYSLHYPDSATQFALCASHRVKFLVHLLALLQSNKIFTVVSYSRRPKRECIEFIESIIWSLNRRVAPTPVPLPCESRILDACAREMKAHAEMILSYRSKKKYRLLLLQKSNESIQESNSSYLKLEGIAKSHMVEYSFEITHSLNDWCGYMFQGMADVTQSKIDTNKIILEFVKSNDRERVYHYGKSSIAIKWYIISLISLLNRQIPTYHLELDNSEHSIFRETLNNMKNLCLLFRFNSRESEFTTLQLVKVDLTERCHNCRPSNILVDNLDRTVNPHTGDIDICPNNLGNSKDAAISKSDKDVTVNKINNEKICDHTVNATGCTDKVETREEYLIRELGLDSKVNKETNTKNESENKTDLIADLKFTKCVKKDNPIPPNYASNNEGNSTKYIINNDKEENMADEEICSNFQNWPKHIKESESNNSNLTDANIQRITAENYESNFRNILKRKIANLEQKTVKKACKKVNIFIENNVNTLVENTKDKEEKCKNIVEDYTEIKTTADIVTSEVSIIDEEHIGDKTLEIIDPIAGEKPNINDSGMLNVETTDIISWPKKILVVHYKYPEYEIDATSVMSLQSLLYDAIIADQYLPRLKCNGLKKGGIVYTCYDYSSYVWLFKHLQWYTLLDYEETSDNSHLIKMKINTFIKVDTDVMFKNIERLYGDIKTCSWKMLQIKYFTNYCVISVEVDDSSMNAIKKEDYSLFVGIDKADISIVYDG